VLRSTPQAMVIQEANAAIAALKRKQFHNPANVIS